MTDCGLDTGNSSDWRKVEDAYPLPCVPRTSTVRRTSTAAAGISEKMLIQDLRQMQESSLLVRKDYQTGSA